MAGQLVITSTHTGGDDDGVASIGYVLALVLLSMQAMYMLRYGLLLYLHHRYKHWQCAGLTKKRLEHRVSYLTKRYRPEAFFWQFVVWARLFVLTAISLSPEFFEYRNSASAVDSALTTSIDQQNSQLIEQDAQERFIVWIHAAAAVVCFVVFWLFHVCMQPYNHGYQNVMESLLYLADVVIIGLGVAYTALADQKEPDGAYKYEWALIGIEALVLTLMIGSLSSAALFLVRKYRRNLRRCGTRGS